ncbi:Phosphatidylglycerophosphatase A [compost metagenome]
MAFLVVLYFVPASLVWQAFAFLLFRLFDILKPPPIRYYDRTFKSGFGVMLDDLVAAFYTLIILALAKFLLG